MNSQPAWWKSGRWNNPALLSRVISGKRRFSIFFRRTGKTWRGVSERCFSHPFEFLLPTLIRRYFRLSRRTEFPDNPGHIPKTVTPRLLPHPSVLPLRFITAISSKANTHFRILLLKTLVGKHPKPSFHSCWFAKLNI